MIRNASVLLAVILGLGPLVSANAHELRPGYLEITETMPSAYDVVWKSPIRMGRPLSVEPLFPDDCETAGHSDQATSDGVLISDRALICASPLQGRRIDLAGLDATLTDVLVRLNPADDAVQALRATPDSPLVEFAAEATQQGVARTYFTLGVEHILSGADHLLFVLALILLITGVRRLVETITAFTVAHSITLVAASLGWLTLPSRPVEAVIALSIVFLASELASKREGRLRLSENWPWLVAFAFGLLHGFGFAGALKEIGLPEGEIPMALFTFNVGVEAGQLLFLAAVLVVLKALSGLQLRKAIDTVASYAIGITASVWLIERVL